MEERIEMEGKDGRKGRGKHLPQIPHAGSANEY